MRSGTIGLKAAMPLALTMLMAILIPKGAKATNYECNTDQVVLWTNGSLAFPPTNTFAGEHEIFRFNGENGDLWLANDKEAAFSPMPFKVTKQMPPDLELFAVYDGGEEKWSAGSSLRISALEKKPGLVFIFDSTADKGIYSGECHIYNDIVWPVNRGNRG